MNVLGLKTIGARLGAGFVVLSLFVVLMGLAGLVAIRSINDYLAEISQRNLPVVEMLLKADKEFAEAALAERTTLFVSVDSEDYVSCVARHGESIERGSSLWSEYLALFGDKDSDLERSLSEAMDAWMLATKEVMTARAEDSRAGRRLAVDLSLAKSGPALVELRETLGGITKREMDLIHAESEHSEREYHLTMIVFGSIAAIALVVAIVLGGFLTRSISGKLRKAVEGLSGSSSTLLETSEGMSKEGALLADGAIRQAASLEETSASLAELCNWTHKSKSEAALTEKAISEVAESVETAHSQTNRLTEYMGSIQKVSLDTEKIVNVIDEIAFQTNLLALNAAVEAARAGEAGAGFSVVAEEVRNLAKRVAQSAKETQGLVASVIERVGEGNEAAKEAHHSIDVISEKTSESLNYVKGICVAAGEQDLGISQIQRSIESIDLDVQKTAEVASSSAELSKYIFREARDMNEHLLEIQHMIGMVSDTAQKCDFSQDASLGHPRGSERSRISAEMFN